MSNQYEFADPPADAISAVKFAASSNRLLVSSWDKFVYLYNAPDQDDGSLIRKFEHRAPVLGVAWGKDDAEAYSVGLDCDVRRIELESGEQTVLSTHGSPAKSVVYSSQHDMVISGSWDSTLHIHLRSSATHSPNTIVLPSKVFDISLTATKLVVAMSSRAVHIYELSSIAEAASASMEEELKVAPWQVRESSLKFMTRAVACMSDDAGYASSSIEGRVAVEWFDSSAESQARKYAFKCHRQAVDGVDVVYPVNALAFHPVYGSFASGGGDGGIALWDGLAKRRIRQYQKYQSSVAALEFSRDGKYLAVGISPGFEDGMEDVKPEEGLVKVFVKELSANEAKGKSK